MVLNNYLSETKCAPKDSTYLQRVFFNWISGGSWKRKGYWGFIALTKNINQKLIIWWNSISLFVVKVLYKVHQKLFALLYWFKYKGSLSSFQNLLYFYHEWRGRIPVCGFQGGLLRFQNFPSQMPRTGRPPDRIPKPPFPGQIEVFVENRQNLRWAQSL